MGGYQQLIRGDIDPRQVPQGFEKPEPFEPGKPTEVKFTLADTTTCFRSGHRIMVQVQSTWFPLVDRNPQTFCDIYTAEAQGFSRRPPSSRKDAAINRKGGLHSMSLMKRISLIFRSKANKALDRAEDPRETLDYSYQRQLELLRRCAAASPTWRPAASGSSCRPTSSSSSRPS